MDQKRKLSRTQLAWVSFTAVTLLAALGLGIGTAVNKSGGEVVEASLRRVKTLAVADYAVTGVGVSLSGTVEPLDSVELRSQMPGEVDAVTVKLGDDVYAGQALVRLVGSDVAAQVAAAEAALQTQQARLDEMKKGTRGETLDIKRVELKMAESNLDQAYRSAVISLSDIFVKVDDAVRKHTDSMFDNDFTDSPSLSFKSLNTQSSIDAVNERRAAKLRLQSWQAEIEGLDPADRNAVIAALDATESRIAEFEPLFDSLSLSLDRTIDVPAAALLSMNQSVSLARQTLRSLPTLVAAQKNAVSNLEINIERIEKELALMESGATAEQVAAQEAVVAQAAAGLRSARVNYDKLVVRSPIAGKVMSVSVGRGDLIGAGQAVAKIVNDAGLEVQAFVSEGDLKNIEVGRAVVVGPDAAGVVARVAPALNARSGKAEIAVVVTELGEVSLRPGQTVDLTIAGDEVPQGPQAGWRVPLQAIRVKDDGSSAVFAIGEEGELVEVAVEMGEITGEDAVVTGSLADYERIVALAGDLEAGETVMAD